METSIFEKDGEVWTRFKIPIKEFRLYKRLIQKYVDLKKPSKQNSRFIYFECKGDLLNGKG